MRPILDIGLVESMENQENIKRGRLSDVLPKPKRLGFSSSEILGPHRALVNRTD
jgi:hypothetical protein